MKHILYDYQQSCTVDEQQLAETRKLLLSEINRIKDAQKDHYETEYASINVLHDDALITRVNTLVQEKKALNPTLIVLIGIGGSNLGTLSVLTAIQKQKASYNRLCFADTVDTDYIATLLRYAEEELIAGNNILINVVSKSGTTTETIANYQLFVAILRKYRPHDYNNFIVVTTDKNSPLWHYAQQKKIATLEVPKNVGGRYSVFSAVGLFPLAMCNVDINALLNGARSALQQCTTTDDNNPAATSAAILFNLYQKNYTVHDTFVFSTELENFGKWYRQLMAESLGKSHDKNGKLINNGITPTVSVGSTDLHSVAQLYLSGPYTTSTNFLSVVSPATELVVPFDETLNNVNSMVQNKSLTTIMDAILQGTMHAYRAQKRPFTHTTLPQKNEFFMGQLMQMKMLEVMYLGFLMNVNPFDQPSVEGYKEKTKELLLHQKI
jgi:glucose-6-phosphate isomerase